QRSALAREKWDERPEYLVETALGACRHRGDVCKDKPIELPTAATVANGATLVTKSARVGEGARMLSPQQQRQVFKGCVDVASVNQVWVPGVGRVSPAAFRVLYGGYTFVMDAENGKMSVDAWEAFTTSRAVRHPVALRAGFWPTKPSGEVVDVNGE